MDKIQFGQKAQKQIEMLSQNIEHLYLVGGIPRDFYLFGKHKTDDIDLTTDLPVEAILEKLKTSFFQPNEQFILCINAGDSIIEITPFKGKDLYEDLENRDLTINTIAIPIINGILDYKNVHDEFGGFRDIQYKVLRTTREQIFIDDPLRILRLFRFYSKLVFDIENLTWRYAVNNRHLIKTVAKERIKKEFDSILKGKYVQIALRNMLHAGILEQLFEGVNPMMKFLHCDKYHFHESIIEHTIRVVQGTKNNRTLQLAAFFRDFGKPAVFDAQKGNHYIGHEKKSTEMADKILFENRYEKQTIQDMKTLITYHDVSLDSKSKFNEIYFYHGERLFQALIQLMLTDKKATFADFEPFEKALLKKAEKTMMYKETFQAIAKKIRGQFLLEIGMKPNPLFSKIIEYLQKKFLKKPDFFCDEALFKATQKIFHFKDHNVQLYYKKETYQRVKEVFKDNIIYGVLEEDIEISFNSQLFEIRYLTLEAFEKIEKRGFSVFYYRNP